MNNSEIPPKFYDKEQRILAPTVGELIKVLQQLPEGMPTTQNDNWEISVCVEVEDDVHSVDFNKRTTIPLDFCESCLS